MGARVVALGKRSLTFLVSAGVTAGDGREEAEVAEVDESGSVGVAEVD